jgi:uncharacterized membrane protein
MKKLFYLTLIIQIFAPFISIRLNRRKENKQDRNLYIALMVGGFIWSQLQTEYLILRIKKDTAKSVKKNIIK